MGFCYGCIFGYLDVEDSKQYKIKVMLLKEESHCWPIGLLIGGFGGLINEVIR